MSRDNKNTTDCMIKHRTTVKTITNALDHDFVPPDGGWGWMIVIAAGISQFCLMAVQQSFGLLFRDRFQQLGITSSEVTVILNVNLAMIAFIGLANGVIFKKFSFRKVAFCGSLINAISLAFLSIATSFHGILLCLTAGLGITMSANSLALNTYFKRKRRIAVGLCWTCTGLGPIIMPQIITILLPIYGVPGTVLLFSGIALNAVACSLLLQPVSWHTKNTSLFDEIMIEAINNKEKGFLPNETEVETIENVDENIINENLEKSSDSIGKRSSLLLASQYLYYDDDENEAENINVISTPATPMITKTKHDNSTNEINKLYNDGDEWKRKMSNQQNVPLLIVSKATEDKINFNDTKKNNDERTMDNEELVEEIKKRQSLSRQFITALIVFFDLNLLRDYVYTNLMLGINFANFTEMNFAMLTPFILAEYGFEKIQVAIVMSVLGSVDVIGRLIISFIATKFTWDNRTFVLIGIGFMAAGRVILAHVTTYNVIIAVGVLIGFGKALRTIFMALVIPSHVPLSRLPAATGLQLVTSGIISIVLGPVVGWIRDICGSYSIVLHILNIMTYLTIISWTLEIYLTSRRQKLNSKC